MIWYFVKNLDNKLTENKLKLENSSNKIASENRTI